jgi:hypothetical protein
MIKERRRHITEEKVAEVKKMVTQGIAIREASRIAKISYYAAWHIVKGSYDNDKRLADAFCEPDNGFFNWNNFKVY